MSSYFFNPEVESQLANPSHQNKAIEHQIIEDLESLLFFFCQKTDTFITRFSISEPYLEYLDSLNTPLPKLINFEKKNIPELIQDFKPWGWSPQLLNSFKITDTEKEAFEKLFLLSSKHHQLNLLKTVDEHSEFSIPIQLVQSQIELADVTKRLFEKGNETLCAKIAYSTAGRGIQTFNQTQSDLEKLSQFLSKHKDLRIEPWLERTADFSILMSCDQNDITQFEITQMLISQQGAYQGTILGPTIKENFNKHLKQTGHTEEHLRHFYSKLSNVYQEISYALMTPLSLCFDNFFYKQGDALGFNACSEINPRLSMGRVALELYKCCSKSSHCIFKLIHSKNSKSSDEINIYLHTLRTLQTIDSLWKEGALLLNDIKENSKFIAVLFIAEELQDCKRDMIQFEKFLST